jgi:hypothetical protein
MFFHMFNIHVFPHVQHELFNKLLMMSVELTASEPSSEDASEAIRPRRARCWELNNLK